MNRLKVIFKKDIGDETIVAFFPDTLIDGSCRRGRLMAYDSIGQHCEEGLKYFHSCEPCSEYEYAPLLVELEEIYPDMELVVVNKQND